MPNGAQRHADDAAEQAEQRGLAEHHVDDAPALPADGQQDADLVGALEDGHQHRVHHAEHADDDGEQRGAPAHGPGDAKSLAGADHLAGHHGAAFREDFLDLLAELGHLLLGGAGGHADVDEVDLALVAGDFLEHLEGENDGAVLHHRLAVDDADHRQFLGLDLHRVADFLLQHLRRQPAEDDGLLGAVAWASGPRPP